MQMLDDHVAVILGGGSGLGLGITRHFIAEGAQVAILEISESKLVDLKAELGDDVLLVQGDVTRVEDLQAAREERGTRAAMSTALRQLGKRSIPRATARQDVR